MQNNKIVRWFKSQPMMLQIGIQLLFILLIVITITILLFQMILASLIPLLVQSQQQLFFMGTQANQNSVLNHQVTLMTEYVNLNSNKLISLHQLVLAAEHQTFNDVGYLRYDYQGAISFPKSLQTDKQVLLTTSFVRSSNQTIFRDETNRKQVVGFSNIIGSLGFFFDTEPFGQSTVLYGAIYDNPRIIYTYPCVSLGKIFPRYQPETRNWHIRAVQQFNQSTFQSYETKLGDPFIRIQRSVDVSLVIPQINSKQQFIGAWALDMQGSVFTNHLAQQQIGDMIILVDKNGLLLVHNFKNPGFIVPLYFYNETITGYTLSDWQATLGNQVHLNNCEPEYTIPGYLCRYNSVQQKYLHIVMRYLVKYELYIIMLSDQSMIKTETQQQTKELETFIQNQANSIIHNILIVFGVSTTIALLVLKIAITQPIINVVKIINSNFRPNFKEKQYLKP